MPFNVIADLDGKSAGLISGTAPENGSVLLISMWVAPFARGYGVGVALVNAVIEWARTQGASQVHLEVRETNAHARALYERCGFVDIGPKAQQSESDPPERRMMRSLDYARDDKG